MTDLKPRQRPGTAIRAMCVQCVCGEFNKITNCTARTPTAIPDPKGCFLWPYRHQKGCDRSREQKPPTRLKSIRRECLNCQGGSSESVKLCPSTKCPLYPYRFGRNPKMQGTGREKNLRGQSTGALDAKETKTPQTKDPSTPNPK